MTDRVQNWRMNLSEGTEAHSETEGDQLDYGEQELLVAPDDLLAGLPEGDESEAGVIYAALLTLPELPQREEAVAFDPQNPLHVVSAGLDTIRGTLTGLLDEARKDYDDKQAFRKPEHTTSAYNRALAAVLDVVDIYTERWGYGARTMYKLDAHQAAESAIARLLGVLAENFDHISFDVKAGEHVNPTYMHVVEQKPTLNTAQVGTVARRVYLGFTNNVGDTVRCAGVDRYEHKDMLRD